MRVFSRVWKHLKGVNRSGMVRLSGSATIGSSGAVSSYDSPGFTITLLSGKTGRYRIQLIDDDGSTQVTPALVYDTDGTTVIAPCGFQDINAAVVSAQADNALTTSSAISWAIRNYTPALGYFDVQFFRSLTSSTNETHTDTNIESGGKFFIAFSVKTSSVKP